MVKYTDVNGNPISGTATGSTNPTVDGPVVDTSGASVGSAHDTTNYKLTEILTADGSKYVPVPSKTTAAVGDPP